MSKDENWYKVWELFSVNGTTLCVLCYSRAISIHEISPRSAGENPLRIKNRVPLCAVCHDVVQSNTRYYAPILLEARSNFLITLDRKDEM